MADIYLVANPLTLSALPSHTAMTALHNTLEPICNIHLPNHSVTVPPPPLLTLTHHTPQATTVFPLTPLTPSLTPFRSARLTNSPTKGELARNWQDLVYTDGFKKGGPYSLGTAATHPASDTRVKILVTSTPPSHTINRVELAGINVGLQVGHTHLLTDIACSLRLIQGCMNCPSGYRHNIHRDTLISVTNTLKTRCESGIRTHLGKIKTHNHSLGNDLADTLANQVADGHPPDTTYITGSDVWIGHWTWPYTLIPQTLREPIPYKYTNLKTDAHT
jgi:ribonuclease HI